MNRFPKKAKRSLIFQHDQSDCGVACLASILKFHGGQFSLDELRRLSGTTKQGTSLLGLLQAAQQLGFDAEGLEAENVTNLNELTHPAILHVNIDGKLQHYIVYFPSESGSLELSIMDPAKGLLKLSPSQLEEIWATKALLKLEPSERLIKAKDRGSKRKSWITDLIRDDFQILAIALFLGIGISVLGISTALFSQRLIDNILPNGDTRKLFLSLILLFLLLIVRCGLQFLRGTFMLRQGVEFNNRVINWFYGKLLYLPKLFFDTRKTGDLIARMHDTRRIQSVLASLSGNVAIDVLVIITSLAFVFSYSAWVGLVLLGCLPIYGLILLFFNKPIVLAQKETMAGYALAESHFVDSMQGIADIKLINRQPFFEKLNATIYREFQNRVKSLGEVNIRFGFLSELAGVFFMIASFGVASWLVLAKQLQIGEMVALLSMAGSIVPSVNRLVVANIQLQEALVAFDRMFEFASVDKEKDNLTEKSLTEIDSILTESVSFRFPGRKQILKEINLEVEKGEMIGLLGESGQGKSTLIQIFQKFYACENGTVLINGKNLNDINTANWRQHVGSISQEPRIFNGTVLFNIILSDDQNEIKSALEYCEATCLDKYFRELPQGYMTVVGDGGINLSGGQKQLIAFARALFQKPKLLLLDEPTSSMDKSLENFVLNLLHLEKPDRITIVVTHRPNPLRYCDRVYQLENGVTKLLENCAVIDNWNKLDEGAVFYQK